MNLKWKFIYLGRRPSRSPLLSPDVLADVDLVDLKLSIKQVSSETRNVTISIVHITSYSLLKVILVISCLCSIMCFQLPIAVNWV